MNTKELQGKIPEITQIKEKFETLEQTTKGDSNRISHKKLSKSLKHEKMHFGII